MKKQPEWKKGLLWARRSLTSLGGPFVLSLGFTLAMLYHYVVPLTALPFSEGIKAQDCYQMVWNLWFVNEAITNGQSPYRTDLLFYPLGAGLSHHSLAAGYFLLTLPVKLLSHGNVMYPFKSYRLSVLLSFTLILYFSFLTLRALGFGGWAALIPPVAYAFGAFYMEHLLHLNQIAGFFIPLTALCLIRSYQQPVTARLMTAALVASSAVYFTELSLYIYMAFVVVIVSLCISPVARRALFEKIRLAGAQRLLLSLTLFALIISPFLITFFTLRSIKPQAGETSLYSADLLGFFIPVWDHSSIYARLISGLSSSLRAGMGEPFLGFPMLLLTGIALVRSERRFIRFSAVAALFFFVLSLGPTLKILGAETGIPLPYAAFMRVPPFDLSRGPVRFVVMGSFFLMIIAASGAAWLERKVSGTHGTRWTTVIMAALCLWVIAESYVPAPHQKVVTVPRGLEKVVPGPVLNLPLIRNDGYAEMLQIFHRQPIATGFLARYTSQQNQQFAYLERLFNKGGSEFCNGIRAMGFHNIVIAPNDIIPNALSIAPLDLAQCPMNVVDLRSGDLYSKVDQERPDQFPLYKPGTQVDFRTPESEQFLWYGWSGRETTHRWSDRTRAAVVFALNESKPLILRARLGAFIVPGAVDQQRVEIELNSHEIAELILRDAQPREYSVNLPQQFLRERNVLTFRLPDAESPSTFELGNDVRLLAIRVDWLELDSE